MENYQLNSDEVVLYKGDGALEDREGKTQIILTNQNLLFITTHINLYKKEEVYVEKFSIDEIKIYEDMPQVKAKGANVEIYLSTCEKVFKFQSKGEAGKFVDAVMKHFTGKTKAERNAEKVKGTINFIDNTFGINSVELVGNALKNGVVNSITGALNKGAKGIGNLFKKKK